MRWTSRLAILNAFQAESIKDRILYIGKLWWKTIYGAANCEHLESKLEHVISIAFL